MRLTNTQKQAFVNGVMQDVPLVDYRTQAHELLKKFAYQALPTRAKVLADDPILAQYLNKTRLWVLGTTFTVVQSGEFKLKDEEAAAIEAILTDEIKQQVLLDKLRKSLIAATAGITTRKQLVAAFPEFEKYAPEESSATPNLPALSNVVAAFSAAGWPKGEAHGR
jgi:hypothetical protein